MSWKVLIERGNLGFAAAHFITFAGLCEPLHGHNYGVRVEVSGPLTSDSYVLDFVTLKDIVRTLCKQWDHRFLLPLNNPHLNVADRDDAWEITYTGDLQFPLPNASSGPVRYLMPKWTVIPLAVDNATAERLAELLTRQLIEELRRRGLAEGLTQVTVGVEETEMQTAFYTADLREARYPE